MDYISFQQAVIAKAQAMGISEYELYYSAGESTSISVFRQEINEFSSAVDGGVCFRCIVGGKMGYAATESLTEREAAAIVERAVDNASVLEAKEPVFLGEGGKNYAPLTVEGYDLPGTEALVDTALQTQKKLYDADSRVIDGTEVQVIAQRSRIAICNSRGLDLRYDNAVTGLVTVAVVSDGKEMADAFQVKLGKLDTIDTDAMTAKAATKALSRLGGDVAPTGQYPIVFSPEAVAALLQTFSGVFSSENAQKGLSKLAGSEGQVVASSVVNLMDDPFHPENPMPIPFDAEGSPTACKAVIEGGVLKTLLYNLKTAAVAGKQTTGNASKAGYDAPVAVRPFSFYLAGGQMTEEELLAKAGNGVYIDSLEGLHSGANPISGDFSLQGGGYLLENGRLTTAVKSFTVAGNFFDLLKNIVAVADNSHLPMAMGMTAFGGPSILVEGLSVAGK